jgi:putative peptidoglycan lipid II flippase
LAEDKSSAVKSSGVLMACTFAAVLFGLVTQFVYARAFGTSRDMDAFWLSFAIVNVFMLGIIAAFNPTLVPALARIPDDSPARDALLKLFLIRIGGASIVSVVLLVGLAEPLVRYLAPGFPESHQKLTVTLLRIQAPSIVFFTVYATVASLYFARKRFTLPPISVATNGFVILAVAVVAIPRLGIVGATLGYTVAYLVQCSLFLPALLRIRKAPTRLVAKPDLSRVLSIFAWLIAAAFLLNMYLILERNIASHLPEGAISYLGYGQRFVSLLNMMFVSTLALYLLPQFSESLQGNDEGRGTTVLTSYKMSMIVSAPLVMGGIACIHLVIFLFLQHGAFSAHDTEQLTYTIWAYGLGAFIIGNGSILTSAIHALRRPRSLIVASVGALLAWLPIAIYASRHHAHLGIAASYFFYAAVLVLLQTLYLRSAVGLGLWRVVSFTGANVIIGVVLWTGFNLLAPQHLDARKDQVLYVVFAAVALACHYGALLVVFRKERATTKLLMNFRALLGW